jgi:hypothetical protein
MDTLGIALVYEWVRLVSVAHGNYLIGPVVDGVRYMPLIPCSYTREYDLYLKLQRKIDRHVILSD